LRHAVHIEARGGTMVPRDTLRHLLLDQIWPLVLSGSGRLVVHASAIVLPDGHAIGFAGPAGAGKSTLAASLVAAGCHLVSDDCLLLENAGRSWRAVPSYPGLRLWPDVLATVLPRDGTVADVAHYTSKKRYADRALPFARTPAPLRALYILHPSKASGKAALTEVTGAAALMDLVPYTYLLDHEDRTQLGRSFAQLAALTRRVRVLRLDVPRTIRRLGEVTELLTRRS
jgi:hypothetical protein